MARRKGRRAGSPVESSPLATFVLTETKLKKETASTRLMVVIRERKNRTRMLLKAMAIDLPHGRTTCRWIWSDSVAGGVGLAVAFISLGKLRFGAYAPRSFQEWSTGVYVPQSLR